MAELIDFATRRGKGTPAGDKSGSSPLDVLSGMVAKMGETRALLEELLTTLMAQREAERLSPAPELPIWRPERPHSWELRSRLRANWRIGMRHVEAAGHLREAARELGLAAREAAGKRWDAPEGKLEVLTCEVWWREVWRQLHIAPYGKPELEWKRRMADLVARQIEARAIVAADAAWLERRNGSMNRYLKAKA